MKQHADEIRLRTAGEVQIIDLTPDLARIVQASAVATGQALLFTTSSTSAITVTEFEPGLVDEDLPAALERLFPRGLDYGHERRWRDGNGHSHVRAAFLKPDLVLPVAESAPALGEWQQVVFVELDNKPRERRVAVRVWGA